MSEEKVWHAGVNEVKGAFFSVGLLLSLLLPGVSLAQEVPPAPTEVHVGVYVSQIPVMSLKDNCFSAMFFVWFRWKGDGLKPHETFEIVSGQVESKEVIYESRGQDYNYVVCRVIARINQLWDVSRFPLDDHTIGIQVEDGASETHQLRYVPDAENSGISPDVAIPGWRVSAVRMEATAHTYETNYGDISLPSGNESTYSRFVFSFDAVRDGMGYYLRLFVGLHVAVFVALLALWIKPDELDPRFGLGAAALFAAVASEYVITSSLPATSILTTSDKLHMLGLATIFLSLVESTVSLALYRKDKGGPWRRCDQVCFVALASFYAIMNLVALL